MDYDFFFRSVSDINLLNWDFALSRPRAVDLNFMGTFFLWNFLFGVDTSLDAENFWLNFIQTFKEPFYLVREASYGR